jgi:hypothetical protein
MRKHTHQGLQKLGNGTELSENGYAEERETYINGGLDLRPGPVERLHAEPLV